MAHQANHLLQLEYLRSDYLFFVFFSTLASYNFHWRLSINADSEKERTRWSRQNKSLHDIFFLVGIAGAAWFGFKFISYWWQLGIAVMLTFLYSAPKLSHAPFTWLRRIAIGKTIFLSFVWTYVTAILPVLLAERPLTPLILFFCLGRYFLVYAVCIVFDYRDREQDRREGIRSLITYLNENGINVLFYASLILSFGLMMAAWYHGLPAIIVAMLVIPHFILPFLFLKGKKDFSDYLYDYAIDGMMVFSALFTSFIEF